MPVKKRKLEIIETFALRVVRFDGFSLALSRYWVLFSEEMSFSFLFEDDKKKDFTPICFGWGLFDLSVAAKKEYCFLINRL